MRINPSRHEPKRRRQHPQISRASSSSWISTMGCCAKCALARASRWMPDTARMAVPQMCCIPNKSRRVMLSGLHAGQEARSMPQAPISLSFASENTEQILFLAQVAQTWNCRPSDLLGLTVGTLDQKLETRIWRLETGENGSSPNSMPEERPSFQFPVSFSAANAAELASD